MNHWRASLWMLAAVLIAHAPYGVTSARTAMTFFPCAAFFYVSSLLPLHILFAFAAGMMTDLWLGTPLGAHGVMFAWMRFFARIPMAMMTTSGGIMALAGALWLLAALLSFMGFGDFAALWQASLYAFVFFSVMMALGADTNGRRYQR